MIIGEYKVSLDEKGRLLIPSRIRSDVAGNLLVITRGIDQCLWLFPPEEWKAISEKLLGTTSIFQEKARMMHRHFIAPAQEVDIDKAGRITVPTTLREYGVLKKDCIVMGIMNHLEIWDEQVYRGYWAQRETVFQEAAEEIGEKLKLL
jgi:MraZ protein